MKHMRLGFNVCGEVFAVDIGYVFGKQRLFTRLVNFSQCVETIPGVGDHRK